MGEEPVCSLMEQVRDEMVTLMGWSVLIRGGLTF